MTNPTGDRIDDGSRSPLARNAGGGRHSRHPVCHGRSPSRKRQPPSGFDEDPPQALCLRLDRNVDTWIATEAPAGRSRSSPPDTISTQPGAVHRRLLRRWGWYTVDDRGVQLTELLELVDGADDQRRLVRCGPGSRTPSSVGSTPPGGTSFCSAAQTIRSDSVSCTRTRQSAGAIRLGLMSLHWRRSASPMRLKTSSSRRPPAPAWRSTPADADCRSSRNTKWAGEPRDDQPQSRSRTVPGHGTRPSSWVTTW